MKKLLNCLAGISLALAILGGSILLTFAFKGSYAWSLPDIQQVEYQLDQATIKANYDGLVDYLLSDENNQLEFKDLPMSREGEIHFKEVKDLVILAKRLLLGAGLLALALGLYLLLKKEVGFLKIASLTVFLLPLLLAIPVLTNFSATFTKFHEIFFSNDYWIFDPAKDPIIRYLPESLFWKNTLLILGLLILAVICLQALRMLLKKRWMKKSH